MSRATHIFVIHRDINHATCNGQLCFGLNKQLDDDMLLSLIQRQQFQGVDSYALLLDMQHDSGRHNVCSKCKLFCVGISDSLVVDSYALDLRDDSDYSIYNLSLGTPDTEFCSLFFEGMGYVEMSMSDIEKGFDTLKSLGQPINHIDIEAYHETLAALYFMEAWAKFPKVRIVLQHV